MVRRAEAAVGDHLAHVVEPLYRREEGGQRHRRDWTDPGDCPDELRFTGRSACGFKLLLERTEERLQRPESVEPGRSPEAFLEAPPGAA